MEFLSELNTYLGDFDNIIGILGILIAIVGIIVGGIGAKELHESNKFRINNSELNNSQVANNITNNNGLNAADTEYLANNIVEEKTKNKPDVILSEDEPVDGTKNDQWLKPY